MYGIYNSNFDYVFAFSNRSYSHTLRSFYVDLHKDEFTQEELTYLEESIFSSDVTHKFIPYNKLSHFDKPKLYISRNPYQRALSIYYLFTNRPNFSRFYPLYEAFDTQFGNNTSFISFLNFLTNNSFDEIHFLPQTYNLDDYNSNLTLAKFTTEKDKILDFFENLGFVRTEIEDKLNFRYANPTPNPSSNSGPLYTLETDDDFSNLPRVELNMSNFSPEGEIRIPGLKHMFNETTEKLIYDLYKIDFDNLNYSRYIY